MSGGISKIFISGKSGILPKPKEMLELNPKKKLNTVSEKLPGSSQRKSLLS